LFSAFTLGQNVEDFGDLVLGISLTTLHVRCRLRSTQGQRAMSQTPEPSERTDERHGIPPRRRRAASLSLACLLFIGAAGAVFAACALWQAGAVVQALLDMTEAAPRTATRIPAAKVEPDAPRVMATAGAERAQLGASVEFEKRAEASEKAIPLGLEPTLNEADEALPLGAPPPPGFPRTRCEEAPKPGPRATPRRRRGKR
jgi:hypothetical protein